MRNKNQGSAIWIIIVQVLFLTTVIYSCTEHASKSLNTQAHHLNKYQEITFLGDGRYVQCIENTKYIVAPRGFFTSGSTIKLVNSSGDSESCEIKIYNYEQVESLNKQNNKQFIQINGI